MKVAAIVPVFNRPELALRAVRSVLAQSYSDIELIVIDDGSTIEHTAVKDLVEKSGGVFIRQERGGVSQARNFGVSQSTADWLAFLDSDDEWVPEKISSQVSEIKKNPKIKIIHCEEVWIRKGKRVNPKRVHQKCSGWSFARCVEMCCISPSAVMIEKRLFEESGGFDERMRVCEDYDLWIRLSADESVSLMNEQLVVKYGGHEDQLSSSEPAIDRFRVFSLIKNLVQMQPSDEQRNLLVTQALEKSRVLEIGARKLGNDHAAILFHDISKNLRDGVDLDLCLQRIEQDILSSGNYEKSCH